MIKAMVYQNGQQQIEDFNQESFPCKAFQKPQQFYKSTPLSKPQSFLSRSEESHAESFKFTADGFQRPVIISCPFCRKIGQTQVIQRCGMSSIIWTGLMFLCSCGVCSWLPWLVCCKDSEHRCQSCGEQVGYFQHPFI